MVFASWVSPEFQLYIMKDYRRLKSDENSRLSLNWNLNREIARFNYKIYTDEIKEDLISSNLAFAKISYTYASEADLLNAALFSMIAKQWREANPDKKGNIRDYAILNQLLILANAESYNSVLINEGTSQGERLVMLRNAIVNQFKAIEQINIENLPILKM